MKNDCLIDSYLERLDELGLSGTGVADLSGIDFTESSESSPY